MYVQKYRAGQYVVIREVEYRGNGTGPWQHQKAVLRGKPDNLKIHLLEWRGIDNEITAILHLV